MLSPTLVHARSVSTASATWYFTTTALLDHLREHCDSVPEVTRVPDAIDRLRRLFSNASNALEQCDRDYRISVEGQPTLLVYRVVCTDGKARNWKVDDIGNLRVALNALVRVFRLGRL